MIAKSEAYGVYHANIKKKTTHPQQNVFQKHYILEIERYLKNNTQTQWSTLVHTQSETWQWN